MPYLFSPMELRAWDLAAEPGVTLPVAPCSHSGCALTLKCHITMQLYLAVLQNSTRTNRREAERTYMVKSKEMLLGDI